IQLPQMLPAAFPQSSSPKASCSAPLTLSDAFILHENCYLCLFPPVTYVTTLYTWRVRPGAFIAGPAVVEPPVVKCRGLWYNEGKQRRNRHARLPVLQDYRRGDPQQESL